MIEIKTLASCLKDEYSPKFKDLRITAQLFDKKGKSNKISSFFSKDGSNLFYSSKVENFVVSLEPSKKSKIEEFSAHGNPLQAF